MKPRILSAARLSYPLAAALATLLASSLQAQTVRSWIGATGGAWLSTSTWSPSGTFAGGAPLANPTGEGANTDIMTTAAANTSANIGINMSSLSAAGGVGLILGGIDFNKTDATALIIGNSSTTVNGILQLNGATINSVANTLVRVAGSANLAINNINTGSGTQTMGLRLGITDGVFDTASGRTLTVGSIISEANSGSSFNKTGAGTIRLNGANTYTGSTNVSAGLLQIANYSGLTNTSSITVSGGGTSQLQLVQVGTGATTNSINKSLSLHGTLSTAGGSSTNTLAQTWAGTITLAGNSTITNNGNSRFLLTNTVDLATFGLTYQADGQGSIISGDIVSTGGGGSLTKTSPQGLTLSGNNSYTGTTTISGGSLAIGNLNALNTTVGITIGNATLSGTGDLNDIVVGGAGSSITLGDTGTATISYGRNTTNVGNMTLTGGITSGAGANLTFTTPNANSGNNLQTIILGSNSGFTGTAPALTTITTGNTSNNGATLEVRAGTTNALPTGTVLHLNGGNGTGSGRTVSYDLNGFNQTLAGLTNQTQLTLRNQRIFNKSSTAATLTINNPVNRVFAGQLSNDTSVGNFGLTKQGVGTFTISGNNAYTGATLILGGILEIGNSNSMQASPLDTAISIVGDATNGLRTTVTTLTMGGLTGNKNLADVFTTTTGGYTGLTALTLNPGSSVTNNFSGDIGDGAGAMTLTKTGAGTQTLSGANSYTGATTISAGTLALGASGSISSSPLVDVRANATFDVSAGGFTLGSGKTLQGRGLVSGTVTAASGAIITGGDGNIGTLTLQDLTFSGTASLNIGTLTNYTSSPAVDATGILTQNGGPGAVTLNLATTSVPTGTYRLLRFGSGITNVAGFTLGTVPTPIGRQSIGTLGIDSIDNYLTYTISSPIVTWTGAQSSEWSTNAITPNQNWALTGPSATDFLIGDDVIFNDTATIKTVDISNGDVAPGSVTFNNSTGNDYTITGTGGITGSTALTKSNTGAVILTTNNTYTGATTISGGTLQLGDGGIDGALSSSSAISVALGASFAVNQSDTVIQGTNFGSAAITGAGGFIQAGSGTTIFTAANSYTGTTAINSGILQLGNGGTTGALTGTTGITSSGTATLAINRSNAFTQVIDLNGQAINDANLSLTKAGGGTATLSLTNTYGGLTTINGGSITITNAAALGSTTAGVVVNGSNTGSTSNARLELSGGITVTGEAATISGVGNFIGAMAGTVGSNVWAGPVTIGLAGTRIGANAGASLEISGIISSGLDENGLAIRTSDLTGVVILSGANTYLGGTSIVVGKLQLAGGNNRLPVGTTLSLIASTLANTTEFDLNGFNQEVAGLSLGGGSAAFNSVNNSDVVNVSTLTVNTPATVPSTFAGVLKGNLALTKTGADSLTISGANTYTGTTTLTQGTLTLGASGTMGASTGSLIVSNTNTGVGTDVVLNLATDVDTTKGNLSGAITPADSGTNSATINIAASRTFTINQTADATYGGAIAGAGGFTLGGLSTSILSLSGLSDTAANNYSGTTTIGASTLALTHATTIDLSGGLTFGTSAGVTSTGNLDLANASATLGGSLLVQTNSATDNTVTIGSGKKLQINGAVNLGTTSGNTTTRLTATGAGTLSLGDNSLPTNANVSIGIGTGDGTRNNSILDLSGLSNFFANLGTGTFRVGSPTNPSGAGTGSGSSVILAENSTIQAATVSLGSADTATQSLRLGADTNALNSDSIIVGTGGRSNSNVIFNGATGNLTVRGLAGGTSRANLTMVNTSFGTGTSISATFDTTDHNADLMFGTMLLGQRAGSSTSGTGNATANFTFNQGTLNANDLTAGSVLSGTAAGNATGNLNLSGGTANFNSSTNPLRLGVNADDARTARGNLNISGTANVTVSANGGVSILLGDASVVGGNAIGALSLTGGTLTVAGDIVRGSATGTVTSTVLVAGGILDMGGNDIGATGAVVSLTAESGTLKNIASLNNNGDLTKTTAGTLTLDGTNTYTGNTVVSDGTLVLADNARLKFVLGNSSGSNNSINGAGTLTLEGDFEIDTTAADALSSGSWTLVDNATLTETYTANFTVVGFSDVGGNKWEKTVGSKKYTYDEATGVLSLGSAASYATWIDGFFPGETNVAIIGGTADPDQDGIANAVEMVLGGNPATGMDSALLPTIELVTDPVSSPAIPAGNYMLFTFRRSDLSVAAGVTSGCEVDGDLVGPWTPATSVSGAVIQVDDNFTFTPAAPNTDRVRVYVPRGSNSNFGRLNVQTP
jgi:autotransporter-associated beta strand protein